MNESRSTATLEGERHTEAALPTVSLTHSCSFPDLLSNNHLKSISIVLSGFISELNVPCCAEIPGNSNLGGF